MSADRGPHGRGAFSGTSLFEGTPVLYYHGGPPGLSEILPPTRTGVMSTLDAARDSGDQALAAKAETLIRRDRVYLTSDPDEAALFAAMNPSGQPGAVYQVEPVGDVEPDPDYTGPAVVVHASRARVRRVVRRGVRLGFTGITWKESNAA